MTVIPFRDPRLARRPLQPVEPPRALAGDYAAAKPAGDTEDPDFYRLRARQNLAVLLVVVVLVVGGAWLIDRLMSFSRAMACYEFGHRNCMPLHVELPRTGSDAR